MQAHCSRVHTSKGDYAGGVCGGRLSAGTLQASPLPGSTPHTPHICSSEEVDIPTPCPSDMHHFGWVHVYRATQAPTCPSWLRRAQ